MDTLIESIPRPEGEHRMIVNFIQAANGTPLVKNLITGESYPNVFEVNSFQHEGENLEFLAEVMKLHAEAGHALLTGELTRPLKGESRAGMVEKTPTNILWLDVDSNDLPFKSRDHLIKTLLKAEPDYVFQHSARSDREDSLRGHYAIHLEEAAEPSRIKELLKSWNVEHLTDQIKLSGNMMSPKWPLDIVVNDPGRVLYIAAPICENDPIKERIILVKGKQERYQLPTAFKTVSVIELVNKLREGKQLAPRAKAGSSIIKIDPNEVKITGIKEDKGFVRLNLNGGDSWGYYFREDAPSVVGNFKGEPNFLLKDLDEELYEKYKPVMPTEPVIERDEQGKPMDVKPYIFRESVRDVYYQVLWKEETDQVMKYTTTGSKSKAYDYLVYHGADKPKVPDEGEVIFDPHSLRAFEPKTKRLNLFRATDYLRVTDTTDEMPPLIEKLIRHLTVNEEAYDHFMNWLAYIFQTRDKTGTAWLFHGHTGTGKGTLFEKIIKPIFGEHAYSCKIEVFLEKHNEFMEKNLITFIDEFDIREIATEAKNWNMLKNLITEETLTIRGMYKASYNAKSHMNLILATNNRAPVKMDESERRLNAPPRQDKPLEELIEIRDLLESELMEFAKYLRGYNVNKKAVHQSLKNEARQEMIADSKTTLDEFFDAVKTGDIEYFRDFMGNDYTDILMRQKYDQIVREWVARSKGIEPYVTSRELHVAYEYILGNGKQVGEIKFRKIARHHGLKVSTRRETMHAQREYVFEVQFAQIELSDIEPKSNVVKIK